MPSMLFAVIVAVPADKAVTIPDWSTFATCGLLLSHTTFFIVALEGVIVAVRVAVEPLYNSIYVLFSFIDDTNVSIFLIFLNFPHSSFIKYFA